MLAASLMLGSASWANAEKQAAPAVGKKPLKEVKVWDLTDWNADTLLIQSSKTEKWVREIKDGVRFNCSEDIRNGQGELVVAKDGAVLPATEGLTWASDEGSKKKWNCTMRAKMDNGENMLQCGRRPQIGFVKTNEYPKVGQVIEITFNSLGTKNVGRGIDLNKSKDLRPLFSTAEKDSLWCGTSTTTTRTCRFVVTGENPKFYGAVGAIGVSRIAIYGADENAETESVKVVYIGDPEASKKYEPVHDALKKIAEQAGNKMEVTYFDATADTKGLTSLSKYDVVVVGSTITGDDKAFYASLDSLIGTVPVLNTKAFWHGKKRLKWANDNGANPADGDTTYQVAPLLQYRKHPVFAGLVDPESVSTQKIDVFSHADVAPSEKANLLQGVPTSIVSNRPDSVPVHTTIAEGKSISNKSINTIAESWSRERPYMLIGINSADLSAKNKPALTDAGVQLIANAVNYLANARMPEAPSYVDTCTLKAEMKMVKDLNTKADGKYNDSDTLRYVLKIESDSVLDANNPTKLIYPTVMVTIGSEAAKEYNAKAPDTLWQPVKIKVEVTAPVCMSVSKEIDFKNPNLTELAAPEPVFTRVYDKAAGDTVRYVLTFEEKTYKLDGVDSIPTIKYSLDGKDPSKIYNAKAPDTLWKDTRVKAVASLYLHTTSAVSDSSWKNPVMPITAKPDVKSVRTGGVKAIYTVTLTADEGATIYYTTDGSEPSTSSSKYAAPFEVEVFDSTIIQTYAEKIYCYDSEVVIDTIKNSEYTPLATPVINVDGASFTIEPLKDVAAEDYDIYYTIDGSEPTDKDNGLIYTKKVTFKGTEKVTVKAIAAGRGYKPAATATEEVTPNEAIAVFQKPRYKSTFNRNDPSVKLEDDPEAEDHTQHVWGWFRWVPEEAGPGAGEKGPWLTKPGASGDHTQGNTYLSDQEYNDGVYYDSQTKPRPNIFINNNQGGWRHFNDWVFYKDPTKSSDKYRRILVQENFSVNRDGAVEGATGGGLYIFNATPKATAGPEKETFKGPFAVVVNISGAEKFNESGAEASVNVCAANEATGSNEMVLGTVSCEAKKMGTDTVRYYGDEEVYLRLATESKEVIVYDFIVYNPGEALAALETTQVPWGTEAAPATVTRGTKEFTVTFNNDVTISGEARFYTGDLVTQIPCTLKPGATAKEVVITLNEAISAADGTLYYFGLPGGAVTDEDGQKNEPVWGYIKVQGGAAGIDEVNAAKEVVATYIYSISGAEVGTLLPGVNFVKKVYSDGTTTTEKIQVVK